MINVMEIFVCSAFDVQSVGNRVGVQEPFLMRMAHGAPVRASYRSKAGPKGLQGKLDNRSLNDHMLSDAHMLRICRRFFVALILSRLVQVNFLEMNGKHYCFPLSH